MTKTEKPQMTTEQRRARRAELEVAVRKAALVLSPRGELNILAQKSGLSYNTITSSLARGWFTAGSASALELAVGREHLKKEDLAPHVYAVQE